MYHMSHFSLIFCYIFYGQTDGPSRWRACYQWGLTRPVLVDPAETFKDQIRLIWIKFQSYFKQDMFLCGHNVVII